MRSGHENLCDAWHRVTNLGKELVLGPHCAAVLPGVVWVVFDVMGLDLLGIELQHFGAVMIDEDNCVLERHGEVSFTRYGTEPRRDGRQ